MSSIIMINKNNENKILDHYTTDLQKQKKSHVSLIKMTNPEIQSYTVSLSLDTDKIKDKKNQTNTNKKNDEINSKDSIQKISPQDTTNQNKPIEKKKEKNTYEENHIKDFIVTAISKIISKCIKFLKSFV